MFSVKSTVFCRLFILLFACKTDPEQNELPFMDNKDDLFYLLVSKEVKDYIFPLL